MKISSPSPCPLRTVDDDMMLSNDLRHGIPSLCKAILFIAALGFLAACEPKDDVPQPPPPIPKDPASERSVESEKDVPGIGICMPCIGPHYDFFSGEYRMLGPSLGPGLGLDMF